MLGLVGAVAERASAQRQPERTQRGVMRDAAECQDRCTRGKRGQLDRQVRIALPDLCRLGLVSGWQALDRVGDARVDQSQPVVDAARVGPRGEAELKERSVEQDARVIAGEGTPDRIGAVHSRGEADDDESRGCRTEGGNRPAMVVRMLGAYRIQKRREPRTAATLGVVNGSGNGGGGDSETAKGSASHVEWRALF